ncbi:hypothetical protein GQ457_08G026380 [Hibiscus cannabinus]
MGVRFLLLPGRRFRDFCSLAYLGGLSRNLYVKFVEIQDSSASYHQEIKFVISPVKFRFVCFLRLIEKGGFRFRSLTIGSRIITDQEVREIVSS